MKSGQREWCVGDETKKKTQTHKRKLEASILSDAVSTTNIINRG
jgi:hypothetical protein